MSVGDKKLERVYLYTDGASRGNPGPAAIGVAILDDEGRVIQILSQALGRRTNNQAEYEAVIRGLEAAKALGAAEVQVRMDSELVVRQLMGLYAVRNSKLIPLAERAIKLLQSFRTYYVMHVPREQNRLADSLANKALDSRQ